MPRVMDDSDILRATRRISHEIIERNRGIDRVILVGIHSRGVPFARRIAAQLQEIEGVDVPVGTLDIGLHRDDVASRPTPVLHETRVPADVSGAVVVLVDDVLYTGRTIRAALDALVDFGRPAAVQLAVLVDRGHRELPIRADHVGKNLPTSPSQRVSVKLAPHDDADGVWIEETS